MKKFVSLALVFTIATLTVANPLIQQLQAQSPSLNN